MTIKTSPLSKLFNFFAPARLAHLNRELLAYAGTVHGGMTEQKLWDKIEGVLRAGADINTTGKTGDTALHMLCEQHHVFAADKLLEHGASTEIVNQGGLTAFLTAARFGDADILKSFVAHRVNLNQVTAPQGENAIQLLLAFVPLSNNKIDGSAERRIEALKVLAEAGMTLDKGNRMRVYHHSPQFLPAVPEIAKIHTLSEAIDAVDAVKARAVIASGVHPDATAEYGDQAALSFAATIGHIPLINDALNAGANINLTSGDQRATALQMAALVGQREAFTRLLDAGANPNQISSRFDAPQLLNAAKECPDAGMAKFVADALDDLAQKNLGLPFHDGLQSKTSVSKVIRLKTNDPGS